MAISFIDLLVVDDDEVDREFIRRLLPQNFHIREASLGIAALSLFKRHAPDCVLLDWQLPDINGPMLLQHFHQAGAPVVVMTSERRPGELVRAMEQGAQDFLLKDELSQHILEQTIRDAIEHVAQPVHA